MPSAPQTIPTSVVFDYLVDPTGAPLVNAEVIVTLDYNASTTITPPTMIQQWQQRALTDNNGYWSVNLIPNNNINPANTYYTVKTANRSYQITVGDTGPYQSTAVGTIVDVPTPLQPAQTNIVGDLTVDGNEHITGDLTVDGNLFAGNGLVQEITSTDLSVSITNPTGPVVDLSVVGGGVTSVTGLPNQVEAVPTTGAVGIRFDPTGLAYNANDGNVPPLQINWATTPIADPSFVFGQSLPFGGATTQYHLAFYAWQHALASSGVAGVSGAVIRGLLVEQDLSTDGGGGFFYGQSIYLSTTKYGSAGTLDEVVGFDINFNSLDAAATKTAVGILITKNRNQAAGFTAQVYLTDVNEGSGGGLGTAPASGNYALYSNSPIPSALGGKLYLGTPANGTQTATGVYGISGVPSNSDGANGDWCISDDGHVYFKTGGAWTAKV